MKKRQQKTKLALYKETIAHLNRSHMQRAWGGTNGTTLDIACSSQRCEEDISNTCSPDPTEQGSTCEIDWMPGDVT